MNWLKSLFTTRRVLVYSAFNDADYAQIASRLMAAGVQFVTKRRGSNKYMGTEWSNQGNPVQYDIYVKTEDEHKASEAIHHPNF